MDKNTIIGGFLPIASPVFSSPIRKYLMAELLIFIGFFVKD
jgi:hypothetical protein